MKYEEALNYINNLEFFGIKLGLENMVRLLDKLDNPQKGLQFIHIAGTNGKGSVSQYLSQVLFSSGYTVGTYTSPHLERLEERFTLNLIPIEPDTLCGLMEELMDVLEDLKKEPDECYPTYFEVTTALALMYFSKAKVDYVVWETGLGGRLDATNVVNSSIQIITNIGLDHTKQLGKTISEIAREKAGIIKEGGVVLTAAEGEALNQIKIIAEGKKAKLYRYGKDFKCRLNQIQYKTADGLKWPVGQEIHYSGRLLDYSNLVTRMTGSHQIQNIGLALAAVEVLIEQSLKAQSPINLHQGIQMDKPVININPFKNEDSCLLPDIHRLTTSGIHEGIKKAFWPGRMEIISESPLVLLDGAHNESGADTLHESLKNDFSYNRLILVLGLSEGEERKKVIQILASLADEIIITSAKTTRALPLDVLTDLAKETGKPFQIAKKSLDALKYAMDKARPDDLICVTGSLYLIGEIRPYFSQTIPFKKG